MKICVQVRCEDTSHFWHFLIGEVFPVVHKGLGCGARIVEVYHPSRKWGSCPLDRFYDDISHEGLTFTKVNEIGKDATKTFKLDETDRWDKWKMPYYSMISNETTRRRVRKVTDYLKTRCEVYLRREGALFSETGEVVVVQHRKDSDDLRDYYSVAKTPSNRYGSRRRSIVGALTHAENILTNQEFSVRSNVKDGAHFFRQMEPYLNARGLVLGHGAGMAWMLFMPKGSKVLEFSPMGKTTDGNPDGTAATAGHRIVREFYNHYEVPLRRRRVKRLLITAGLLQKVPKATATGED